jgi:hypothetical protein
MLVEWSLLIPLTIILAGIIVAFFWTKSGQIEARIEASTRQHDASARAAAQSQNQEKVATAAAANAEQGRHEDHFHAGSPMTKKHSIQREEILCPKEVQQDVEQTQTEKSKRAKMLNAEQNMQSVAALLASAKQETAERTLAPPGSSDAVARRGWVEEPSESKANLTPQRLLALNAVCHEVQQDVEQTQTEKSKRAKMLNAEQNMQSVAALLASAKQETAERTLAPPGSSDAVARVWANESQRAKEIQQELDEIRAKQSKRDKSFEKDQNTKIVAALIASEIASKAGPEKHPVSPTGSDVLSWRSSASPLRAGVSPSRAGGGVVVAGRGGGELPFESKAELPPGRVPGLRLVLSRSCVKQPKIAPVPQTVTLADLSGSFALGCTVPEDLLATMDWRGKHTQKGSQAYADAKSVISRAQQLIKSDLANPQAEPWLLAPAGRGFVSPIL